MMRQMMFALSLGFGAVILLTLHAAAQSAPPCGPRQQVIDRLTKDFGESRRAIGLAGPSAVMELFASDDGGTWSITLTRPDGRTCLVAAGQGFEAMDDPTPTGAPL